jgi:uncharacterized protein (TIGR02231 family)
MKKKVNKQWLLNAFLSLPLLASFACYADFIQIKLSLDSVTLYAKGAELSATATTQIPAGESDIILMQVAKDIHPASINIDVGSKAMILATTLKNDYLVNYPESAQVKALKQQLQQLQTKLDDKNIRLAVIEEEISLLTGNRIDHLKKTTSPITEAANIIHFIRENLTQALSAKTALIQEIKHITDDIDNIQHQLINEQGQTQEFTPVIILKIYAEKAVTLPISISYVTYSAGWEQSYDLRVQDINTPAHLTYKANIYQDTGFDWQNIDLTLSTANPTDNSQITPLIPWVISIKNNDHDSDYNRLYSSKLVSKATMSMMAISDEQHLALTDYISINTQGINQQYHIQLPFTLKGHSQDNVVILKETEVAATYQYVATPKLDNNAYLLAKISDWQHLDLLPGKAMIFFANKYVGEQLIATTQVADTLDIALGRDKNIYIQRQQNTNQLSKPSFLGKNVSQKFAYTIDIKNAKTLPVTMTIYDQLPVIQNERIRLDNIQYSGAIYNKENGFLSWTLTLNPNEQKQLPFSFNVTYPQGSVVSGL